MRLLSRLITAVVICVIAIALPVSSTQAQGPEIDLSLTSGVPGDDLTVSGSNFTAGQYVDVYYDADGDEDFADEEWVGDATVGSDKTFHVTFEVPESYQGKHGVYAEDTYSQHDSVDFNVKPGLTVSPEDGTVGANVTVEGRGFGKDERSIEVRYYSGSDYDTVLENIEADENGSWLGSFWLPSSAKGAHRIDATGESSGSTAVRDTTFEVTPEISLARLSGSPGQNITMTGSGFYAGDRYIEILFEGEEAQVGIIRADDSGYWQGDFEVPEMPIGTYSVTAEGELTPEQDITPVTFEIKPGLVLSPSAGHVGTELTVTGYGFPVNEDVDVLYDGNRMGTAETGSAGSFELGVVVPSSQHGQRHVTAEDTVGNIATAFFTMESTPPGGPDPISPDDGDRAGFIGRVRPTFEWSAVSDDSGVRYNLQIARGNNVTAAGFADPVVSVTDIVGTNYTLARGEALSYGTYYWIVQAVDGADNESGWTAARSFHAGRLPLWSFVLIVLAIVAGIGTAVYFFVIRRRVYYL